MARSELRIDWANHKAARHACERWHYSGCTPSGKTVKFGAWENGRFIGVVIYGMGSGKATNGSRYGLAQSHEVAELARVALRDHQCEVSRIIAITLRMMRRHCPGIRLVLSLADPNQDHHGGIYQAGNWFYTGTSGAARYYRVNGKIMHPRSVYANAGENSLRGARRLDKNAEAIQMPGKHRYLMPLDADIADKVRSMAKPYPKRAKGQDVENHSTLGGSTPTRTLQTNGTDYG